MMNGKVGQPISLEQREYEQELYAELDAENIDLSN